MKEIQRFIVCVYPTRKTIKAAACNGDFRYEGNFKWKLRQSLRVELECLHNLFSRSIGGQD